MAGRERAERFYPFGWSDGDEQYAIDEDAVTNVQNTEVRLREDSY